MAVKAFLSSCFAESVTLLKAANEKVGKVSVLDGVEGQEGGEGGGMDSPAVRASRHDMTLSSARATAHQGVPTPKAGS